MSDPGMPTYEQLSVSENEMRYEAGIYHSLYDLWEKRANSYQGMIIELIAALKMWEKFGECQTDENIEAAKNASKFAWDRVNAPVSAPGERQ